MNTSAPHSGAGRGRAKIILFGEHAVVHGQPALAAALDRGVRTTATVGGGPGLVVPRWDVEVVPDSAAGDDLSRAMGLLFEAALPEARQARVVVEPEVPGRAGMGSSAALAVAVVRALAALTGEELEPSQVEARVALSEEVFHGHASGIDAAVATRGGVLRFLKGAEPSAVRCGGGAPLPFVVAQVEPRVPTRTMVGRVADALAARPDEFGARFAEIGALVPRAEAAMAAADLVALGRLMDENQRLLQGLDVSTELLDAACAAARGAGALGAKLTGAGGGGCIIALVPPDQAEAVAAALAPRSTWVEVARVGDGRTDSGI